MLLCSSKVHNYLLKLTLFSIQTAGQLTVVRTRGVYYYYCSGPAFPLPVHAGSVRVYDLPTRVVLCHSQFSSGGSSLLWAPPTIDPTTTTLITGHQDGVLRWDSMIRTIILYMKTCMEQLRVFTVLLVCSKVYVT